ncbi:hypothetical protein NOVA_02715 [Nocardia nova]|uniref:hypothetical protein n=1 Tax=Nocardia nova TaxID=37330 RepID=UPI001C46DC45|nr:hypothetical protein [Nocardia nova]MBV7701674.1 hypothetical protein [Nocardia nova]
MMEVRSVPPPITRLLDGATLDSPVVLVVDDGRLKTTWPFLGDRLRDGLVSRDLTVMWESLPAGKSLRDIERIATVTALVLLDVEPGAEDIAAMPRLEVVAGVTGAGPAVAPQLAARGIPYVDGSRGQSYSRAEMALALTLSALRQLPSWHVKTAVEGPPGVAASQLAVQRPLRLRERHPARQTRRRDGSGFGRNARRRPM